MRPMNFFVISAAILACVLADDADKKYPPDPIDPPDTYPPDEYPVPDKPSYGYSYGSDYKPSDVYKPPTDYQPDDYKPSYDYKPGDYKPTDVYKPPGDYQPDDYKPPDAYNPDYKPPGYVDYNPPVIYPVPGPACKSNNVCEKKGYKCCACADCTSDSFGCAETCACCPHQSVCCKSALKKHFCCPKGSQCDNNHGVCITVKKVKPTKADIFCGCCDNYVTTY